MINNELLKILACPACKTDVIFSEEKIICKQCRRKYPVKNDIPIMLLEEAEEPENIK